MTSPDGILEAKMKMCIGVPHRDWSSWSKSRIKSSKREIALLDDASCALVVKPGALPSRRRLAINRAQLQGAGHARRMTSITDQRAISRTICATHQ